MKIIWIIKSIIITCPSSLEISNQLIKSFQVSLLFPFEAGIEFPFPVLNHNNWLIYQTNQYLISMLIDLLGY